MFALLCGLCRAKASDATAFALRRTRVRARRYTVPKVRVTRCKIFDPMRRALDLLLKPALTDFVFTSALKMKPPELLAGASQAARAVHQAHSEAILGSSTDLLSEFLDSGSLDAALHDHLVEMALPGARMFSSSLLAERRRHLDAEPTLERLRLVIGCQREGFDGADRHRLAIGSNIVVVGQAGEDTSELWGLATRLRKQREALGTHGCTVHVQLKFDAGREGPYGGTMPQLFTFEAAVPGANLRGQDLFTVPLDPDPEDAADTAEEVSFVLVDINRHLRGNEFWTSAAEVKSLRKLWAK